MTTCDHTPAEALLKERIRVHECQITYCQEQIREAKAALVALRQGLPAFVEAPPIRRKSWWRVR